MTLLKLVLFNMTRIMKDQGKVFLWKICDLSFAKICLKLHTWVPYKKEKGYFNVIRSLPKHVWGGYVMNNFERLWRNKRRYFHVKFVIWALLKLFEVTWVLIKKEKYYFNAIHKKFAKAYLRWLYTIRNFRM